MSQGLGYLAWLATLVLALKYLSHSRASRATPNADWALYCSLDLRWLKGFRRIGLDGSFDSAQDDICGVQTTGPMALLYVEALAWTLTLHHLTSYRRNAK